MIKTIYFDLGNVLIFFSPDKMFAQLSKCIGISAAEIKEKLYETSLREEFETGKIGTEDLYRYFSKQGKREFSLSEFTTAFADIFTPNKELWPLVAQLKKQGIRLVLLSNTSECHYRFIDTHYPILKQFDHCVLSYEVGTWKPDPHIFKKALEHAKCAPHECFYTDDIPEFITSARNVGLPGEVFTDVPSLKKKLVSRGCSLK